MKYYIIAGEPSGDIYGAALMKELKLTDNEAQFRFWGSNQMKSVSDNCDVSIEETSFMGLVEVLKNIRKVISLFSRAKKFILSYKPDLLILIDYPGFNLRMAKWAKKNNIRVAYYISPQIWAWRKYRYKTIRDCTDLFFPILPFEKKIYTELGVKFKYCGHPLLERIPNSLSKNNIHQIKRIGLFPGSRLQEIRKTLPVLAEFAKANPSFVFYLSVMPHIAKIEYDKYFNNIDVRREINTLDAVKASDIAIACSGTLSLELALYNVPQIVFYKTNTLSYQLAKKLIDIKYISLVNLIRIDTIVEELIQERLTLKNLQSSFDRLSQTDSLKKQYNAYKIIRDSLGNDNCSQCIAQHIYRYMKSLT